MTLRVTNAKSKVVIVHLQEGGQRCYLGVPVQRGPGGSQDTRHLVRNVTPQNGESHGTKAAACGSRGHLPENCHVRSTDL